ncbi:hypothetical protein F503_03789 [Ophiostoma piceae UAMH 11346]|uniref:Uncharacterized protein n=1 Tax=Ophiostoma piceae (strain UAMH 11346) TaxID=1262450 RepID=S3BVD9_OPHP1|nr:hypothetical protein F503_03789 [Ophiostoma piceae UAMH 11346]
MDGYEGFYGTPRHPRGRSISMQQPAQQPPAFVQWAPQPLPGLFQLVPVDGACFGYQPVYNHQPQAQQHQAQQHQAHQNSQHQVQQSQPPQFYTLPAMTMSPVSPTHNFVSPMSPLRRQVSLGMIGTPGSMGGYYQQQPQGQPQQASPHQQQQPSQSTPLHTAASAPGPSYLSRYAASPETGPSFHLSPMNGHPAIMFATPSSERHMSVDTGSGARDPPMPLRPATVPRMAAAGAHASQRMQRANRPKPLSLSSSTFGRGPSRENVRGSVRNMRVNHTIPSVTPVGSDREYDAGGSSYSTSPIGSETNYTYHSGSHRNYALGLRSETSEAGTDGPRGPRSLWHSAPRTMPKMPKNVANNVASMGDEDGPPSPTPRARSLRTAHGKSRLGLLQGEPPKYYYGNGEDEDEDESDRPARGVEHSSSDECYTTSDTNPIRRRHRHRVAADDEARPERPGLCNCGMQQCYECGLFISRPGSHTCMAGG